MIIFHDPFFIQNDPYLTSYGYSMIPFLSNNSYQHILAILHRFWFSHVSPFLRLAYLIFTSGSTGKPKAIQRDCGVEKTRSREEFPMRFLWDFPKKTCFSYGMNTRNAKENSLRTKLRAGVFHTSHLKNFMVFFLNFGWCLLVGSRYKWPLIPNFSRFFLCQAVMIRHKSALNVARLWTKCAACLRNIS